MRQIISGQFDQHEPATGLMLRTPPRPSCHSVAHIMHFSGHRLDPL